MKRNLIAVFALALGLTAGCADHASEPTSLQPQFDKPGNDPKLVELQLEAEYNAEVVLIDREGGTVTDAKNGHELAVPRGAVSDLTWFVMGTAGGNKVVVELHAFRAKDLARVSNFPRALQLKLNYAKANVNNPHGLKIVYVASPFDFTILEVFNSQVDRNSMQVVANIDHFSTYSMALD